MFVLDPAFTLTSAPLSQLALCEVRVQSDARYPWLVLIPRVDAARELEDLTPGQRALFVQDLVRAGQAVRAMGRAAGRDVAKLNIGLLGNITPQLHAHVVGRRPDDPAWPGPVWGHGVAETPDPALWETICRAALTVLEGDAY